MASPYISQAGLAVLLAILFAYHLQLREKYQQLKVSCEEKTIENKGQPLKSTGGRSLKIPTGDTKASFVMHSSSKGEVHEDDDVIKVERNRYVEEYEPTLFNKGEREVMHVASSSSSIDPDAGVSKAAFQTSSVKQQQMNVNTLPSKKTKSMPQVMVSTVDSDKSIVPSQSSSLQLTERNIQPLETSIRNKKQNETLNKWEKLNERLKHERPLESQDQDVNFDVGQEFDHMYETYNEVTVEYNSADHDGNSMKWSSEFTEEAEFSVLRTSSQDPEVDSASHDHMYFGSQDSTSVLNTQNAELFDLQTDFTDFLDDRDEGSCGTYDCQFEEESYDMEKKDLVNSYKDKEINVDDSVIEQSKSTEKIITRFEKEDRDSFVSQGTSVWCERDPVSTCRFKNLCYHTLERDFVFFKGENSILELGQRSDNVDIFDINLSTIQGHNTQMFSVVTLSASDIDKFSPGMVIQRALAMNRFKPDNIMHVLHDDILPLHDTLNHLKFAHSGNVFGVALVFTDSYEDGDYLDLYSSLSSFSPISPWKFNQTYDLLCFSEIHVGLQISTVWYQYGFFKPQGPVSSVPNSVIERVHKATKFLSHHFDIECPLCTEGNYLVFLSRKDNRLILNEVELIMSIIRATKLKVMSVSLETHSLSDIITTIRQSKGVFGMHGSLLSLAIFLPPGSVLIELFPFAVNPSKYTPFKTYCDLAGSGVVYKSWANPWREKSVPHPDRPTSEGGIQHLPQSKQEEISLQTEVPEHLCCNDPSWLYHIYQDTHVDVKAIISLMTEALHEAENIRVLSSLSNYAFLDIPGPVKNLQCLKDETADLKSKSCSYVISWSAPWSSRFDSALKDFKYELVTQEEVDKEGVSIILPSSQLSYCYISKKTEKNDVVATNVWIRVHTNSGHKGQNKFVRCER